MPVHFLYTMPSPWVYGYLQGLLISPASCGNTAYTWQNVKKIKNNIEFPGAITVHSRWEYTLIAMAMTSLWLFHKSIRPGAQMQQTSWDERQVRIKSICLHQCTIKCLKRCFQFIHITPICVCVPFPFQKSVNKLACQGTGKINPYIEHHGFFPSPFIWALWLPRVLLLFDFSCKCKNALHPPPYSRKQHFKKC